MSNYKDRERQYLRLIEQTPLPNNTQNDIRGFIQSMSFSLSALSRYQYLLDIVNFLEYLEDPTLDELAHLKLKDFENYLCYLQDHETEDGTRTSNCNISLKKRLSSIRKFFDYLARNYEDNDELQAAFTNTGKVILPKRAKRRLITYMDKSEVQDFRSEIINASSLSPRQQKFHEYTKERDLAICDLMLSTGLRLSEVSNLDLRDINMKDKNLVCIRKGGFPDLIYFSDDAAESLEAYLLIREERFLSENSTEQDKKALFISNNGHRMSDKAIRNMIEKYAGNSVPNKHITPHKLRATFATALYAETRDVYAVATALGHRQVETTKEYYAHISEDIKKENRNKVDWD